MQRRAFLAAVAGGVSVPLAGCGVLNAGGGLSAADYDIGMGSNDFRPREYTEATVGEPVVWGNDSSQTHTVTAYDTGLPEGGAYFASGGFESEDAAREAWRSFSGERGAIDIGETYEHAFEVPGTYSYFCIPHEPADMVGSVVVSE